MLLNLIQAGLGLAADKKDKDRFLGNTGFNQAVNQALVVSNLDLGTGYYAPVAPLPIRATTAGSGQPRYSEGIAVSSTVGWGDIFVDVNNTNLAQAGGVLMVAQDIPTSVQAYNYASGYAAFDEVLG